MAYKNLKEFINILEKMGELVRVKALVDPELEITEITDRVSKSGGPALLFENVKGSDMPLLINAYGSPHRMALSLGVDNTKEIARRIQELLRHETPKSLLDKIKTIPSLYGLSKVFPKIVKSAPCQEVVYKGDDVDLGILPIIKCWPNDAGKFITLPCVFTKDPKTGLRNCGMYRMQVYDKCTTGMHWHTHHQGADHERKNRQGRSERMEVAVSLGGDPAVTYAATAPLPEGVDEMIFAGFIRQEPVNMVKCLTVDLEVPADSEIVLEGYVDLSENRVEGPFGDHTGFYSPADKYPVFHITCMTHSLNPIYPTTIVGLPPMEDTYMGIATGDIFLPLITTMVPEVVNIALPVEGVFHNMLFVAIDKKYPMHAQKIMNYIWGTGQLMFTKMIVVVDKDVDVSNTSEVLFMLGSNVDWSRDTVIVKGPVDALDHSSDMPFWGNKIGIDATKKWASEGYGRDWPDKITMSSEIKEAVSLRWAELGIVSDRNIK